jgi:thioredoxin
MGKYLKIMEITGLELQEKIKNGEHFILELWGTWCGPCKMMKPIFEKVASENTTGVGMYTMDVDLNREAALSLNVRSIPTTLVFNGGDVKSTKVGVLKEGEIKELMTELING